jgi:serine/threonine protein kinase
VYKARDTRLGRIVALKFLPEHAAASNEFRSRFLREAKAASTLNHLNIMTVHEIDEERGQFFLVTEYVDGVTLRALLWSESLDVGLALESAEQALELARRPPGQELIMEG